jgi:D-alanyl-D-alanine carboxypeptidase/D-alanyl-D-alanine-endopeptidase (penicillin-binding protein 4)
MMRWLHFLTTAFAFSLLACSSSRQIGKSAHQNVLRDSALLTAHVGISVFDTETGRYLYNHQGDKYFVPASNIKIPTCYAAMKYLGDSLVSARIAKADDGAIELFPNADPTFLHPEFKFQPLHAALKGNKVIRWDLTGWKEERWGSGWSWNDYDASYMVERSALPIYANLMTVALEGNRLKAFPKPSNIYRNIPDSLEFDPETGTIKSKQFQVSRFIDKNDLRILPAGQTFTRAIFPIRTEVQFISNLLRDTLHADNVSSFNVAQGYYYGAAKTVIRSQPTDSLLKPMMHRSDNFFAEQSLLMVSNEVLGYMSDSKIIDTILKTDFADLPQKPRWADGSGLSRYNLFTPQSMVAILNKMRLQFGMNRIKEIFPTGNEGTLSNYYKSSSGYLFAKTGTLSGVVAFSGFLYTRKNKLLIISVLVNNHQASATAVRRAVERFVEGLRNEY